MNGDASEICEASEKIQLFCIDNGVEKKITMRISLAIEEILAVITQMNESVIIDFDIRVFAIQGVNGIRIRYNGVDFNPLEIPEDDERYLGVMMISNLSENVEYNKVLGLNSMIIII